jgi:hypothetical protein
VAATKAAARAITVICQPGMPPALTSGAVAGLYGPSGVIGMIAAEAAGTTTIQASRPPAAAAMAAMIRRGRAAICGWVPRRKRCVNMIYSRCPELAGVSA